MSPSIRPPDVRRVVVLFPSGLTLANLFFGVFAIITAARGDYTRAGWYVVLGGMADAFDGRVARATNTGGPFGEELDSLVDAITFGLAPALIMYFAVLNRDNWDWIWSFVFAACAVVRLARFNIEQAGTAKTYFQGLPSPAAGITLATYYWFSQSPLYESAMAGWPWQVILRYVMVGLAFLMISNVPYPVLPGIGFRSARGLIGLGILLIAVFMLTFGKLEYFFPLAVAYVAFGLGRAVLLGLIERRQAVPGAPWSPGAGTWVSARRATDFQSVESVGDDASPRRRRRRRRSRGDHPDRPDRPDRGDRDRDRPNTSPPEHPQ